jgi:hypothetical protein
MRDALAATAKVGRLYTPPEAERPVVYMALQGEQLLSLGKGCQPCSGSSRLDG